MIEAANLMLLSCTATSHSGAEISAEAMESRGRIWDQAETD